MFSRCERREALTVDEFFSFMIEATARLGERAGDNNGERIGERIGTGVPVSTLGRSCSASGRNVLDSGMVMERFSVGLD